jgi:hypothetical protein
MGAGGINTNNFRTWNGYSIVFDMEQHGITSLDLYITLMIQNFEPWWFRPIYNVFS